ncbi:MFS drug transporter [Sclerotinia borealis F-4128]|uniref:MFS drug transporter n=1 Tax=Sclerotinia borealis (strain F-4128) TaxID=1432307 RepID=W9CQL4_SCLBF|nr:MFS drug transporter [Sclerotinia borealis F-4128]
MKTNLPRDVVPFADVAVESFSPVTNSPKSDEPVTTVEPAFKTTRGRFRTNNNSHTNDLKSASGHAWITAAYFLANAIAGPIWSKLSAIWGRKVILFTAVALYFCFSIVCALSQSMQMLIIGRSLQGAAGGALLQVVYATISDIFSMRVRTFYLSLLQIMWAIAGGIGPVVGGFFAELWIGLNFGGDLDPWGSPLVICLLVASVFIAPVFVMCEKKARSPLVPLDIFGTVSNVMAFVIGFAHDWAVFSTEFYLPLYFQAVKNASPRESGLRIIPITCTQAVVGMGAGLIVHKSGRYLELIWIGVALLALGNGLHINLNVASTLSAIVAFQLVAATGAGLLFQPPLVALQALVPPHMTASTTSALGLIGNLSTSMAIVMGHVIFSHGMDAQRNNLLDHGLFENLADSFSGSSAAASVGLISTIPDPELQVIVQGAFADSLRGAGIEQDFYRASDGPRELVNIVGG